MTQTVEFSYTTGQTLDLKLFALGSDTVVSSGSATESTNRKSIYSSSFSGIDPGVYRGIVFNSNQGVANGFVSIESSSGVYEIEGSKGNINTVSSGAVQDMFSTYVIPESYPSVGSLGTPAQILYFLQQMFGDFSVSGNTVTVRKIDGTTAATFTLDSGDFPTSRTRST